MTHKFRAWDDFGGVMLDWLTLCQTAFNRGPNELSLIYKVITNYAGQFNVMLASPWHDRNGKQIYEGDILEIVDDRGVTIRVICQYGEHVRTMDRGYAVAIAGFAFVRLYDYYPTFPILNNYAGKSDLEIIEIIGNRFENPELI